MTYRAFALAGAATLLSAPALAQDNSRFTPIQSNDRLYTCEQLEAEAQVMADTLGAAPDGAFGGAGAALAQTAMTELAVRSGAASQIGGALGGIGGGLFGAARGAIEQQQEAARQAEEERKEMAQDRWYYLAGLYQGKACDQPAAPPQPVPPAPVPQGAEAAQPAGPQPVGPQPVTPQQ